MPFYDWNESKRRENFRKHGFDFADAPALFDGYTLTVEDSREAYGEQRFKTVGLLFGLVVSVVHVERRGVVRIISMRKATKHEARIYFAQIQD
jgi:hypothetical protein